MPMLKLVYILGLVLFGSVTAYAQTPPQISTTGAGLGAVTGGGGGGPVVFDASAVGANLVGSAGTSGNQTWTHTPVGTPTAAAVLVNFYNPSGTYASITSVTYGGTSMGAAAVTQTFAGSGDTAQIFCLANPPAGAKTVIVNWSNPGAGGQYQNGASVTVTGSNIASCFSHVGSGTGTGTAISASITSATNELILDLADVSNASASMTPGGGQTQIGSTNNGSITAAISTKPGTASTTMSWTSGASANWNEVIASFH
jgi:hypothetical protein